MSSIHEVAKRAGVSAATVSRTFSDSGLINAQTQERVREAARQLDYQPRRLRATAPVTRAITSTSDAIGFQFFAAYPEDTLLSNPFYAAILAGAQAEASSLGLHLLLHTTDRHSLSQEMPRMVSERAVGGMLLVGTTEPAILSRFADYVPNLVLIDNRDESGCCESVLSDGFGGGLAAGRLLIQRGHRRIGFFQSEGNVPTFTDRLHGLQCALLEAGLGVEPPHLIVGPDAAQSQSRLEALLSGPQPITALLTANDEHALLVLRLCRGLGRRVPEDVSLVGFDDIAYAQHTEPALTTLRVHKEQLGRVGVRRLFARMTQRAPQAGDETRVCSIVPVSLIERDSVASP